MKMKSLQSALKFWQEIFFVVSMGFGLTAFAKAVILGYTMDGWDIFLVCWFVPILICLVSQFFWKSGGLAICLSVLLGLSSFVVILMGLYGVSTNGVTLYLIQSNILLIWGIIGFVAAISMTVDFKLRPAQIRDFKKKQVIGVLAAIIVIVGIGYGNRALLFYYAINSNSCERYNIDNIETRTPIDIPARHRQDDCSCILDKEANTKTNYFRIRTEWVDMDKYVENNSFAPVHEKDLDLSVFGKLVKIPEITSENRQNFYYHSGNTKRTDWLGIVDKNSGDLWVHMIYKD